MKLQIKHNLFVIEDCAQAHGAYYESKSWKFWAICLASVLSKKTWTMMWSIITNSKNFARECNPLREWLEKKIYQRVERMEFKAR